MKQEHKQLVLKVIKDELSEKEAMLNIIKSEIRKEQSLAGKSYQEQRKSEHEEIIRLLKEAIELMKKDGYQ